MTSIRHSMSSGDLDNVIMAYDDSQNAAHSITQSVDISPTEAPVQKAKSGRTWNSKKLKQFSEQLLKPFATISNRTKTKRASLASLNDSFSSMMRPLPNPPDSDGEAWDEDEFDNDCSETTDPHPVMKRVPGRPTFSSTGSVPPPPNIPNRQLPPPPAPIDDNNEPPPSLPPRAGGRLPGNKPVTPAHMKPAYCPPSLDDDPSEDYLEPETQQRQEEEYEIPPDEQEYEEANDCQNYRSNRKHSEPQMEMDHYPEDDYIAPEETYEEPNEMQNMTHRPSIPRPPKEPSSNVEEMTYEEPESIAQKIPPMKPNVNPQIPPMKPNVKPAGWNPPKSMALREKKGGLRPVKQVFPNEPRKLPETPSDDDDDDVANNGGTIQSIMQRLAKKSSMFQAGHKTVQPTSRPVPRPPANEHPNESNRSSASPDSGSGSGTIVDGGKYVPDREKEPFTIVKQKNTVRPEDEVWYFNIERNEVDDMLGKKNGMFLVRPSKWGGPQAPYTLCVFHNVRIFNLNIRLRDDKKYALGTPQENEKTFDTVSELIKYHHHHPIILAGKEKGSVLLIGSPPRDAIYDCTA